MTSLVRYIPDERMLDLAQLSASDFDLITGLHSQIHRHDGLILECLSTSGDRAMYVWRDSDGRYWARHFPGGSHGRHPITRESPDHINRKLYILSAAERVGLIAEPEFTTSKRTRLDVAINGGTVPTGVEVQLKEIPNPQVKARTTRSYRAGFTVAWFNDKGPRSRMLADVPAFGCNPLPWAEELPKPGHAVATGLARIDSLRCTVANFPQCPAGNYRPCGRYHPKQEALAGYSVDAVAALMPAGEIVPLRLMNGNVVLTLRRHLDLHMELTDGSGLWTPGSRAKPQTEDYRTAAKCRSEAHLRMGPTGQSIALPTAPPTYKRRQGLCNAGVQPCGAPARLYSCGWRCEAHRPGQAVA